MSRVRKVVPQPVIVAGVALTVEQSVILTSAAASADVWDGIPDEPVGVFLERQLEPTDRLQKVQASLKKMTSIADEVLETLRHLKFKLVGDFLAVSVLELLQALRTLWANHKNELC